ncbi:ABC transporter ATP-binding protein [Marilutibacter alkalisoli]|uniref:ABC transporter ATP-binding protein n=1 Tax=Marilutibacter alkalisoli TaxID=2591633 RepID=A0A514BUY9_9GAMM|nr:ABC transporter ATP-binding protein [Lysobacter alkalisoli]QDH71177.1 ABC transporter ATP-binding protein [Lysobacter alkalisoli]
MAVHAVIPARLHAVHKAYGTVQALAGIDLELRPGRLLALLGPNGAGKTTAIALLLGLQAADSGAVELFGRNPRDIAARRQVGVMLQAAEVQDTLKVRELLELTRSYYPAPRSIADCVAMARLDGLMERRYGKLSGGQQRRVQFALAVCGNPKLLFLDEPTTGLDIEARQAMWKAIRMLVTDGCAVLLTTHYLEEAEALADRVAVIDKGHLIVEGSVQEIRARVSQRRIRCTTSLPADVIAAWPQVREVRLEGEQASGWKLEIIVDAAEPVVRRLLADDALLMELEVQRAGLADAFLALTRNEDAAMPAMKEVA